MGRGMLGHTLEGTMQVPPEGMLPGDDEVGPDEPLSTKHPCRALCAESHPGNVMLPLVHVGCVDSTQRR